MLQGPHLLSSFSADICAATCVAQAETYKVVRIVVVFIRWVWLCLFVTLCVSENTLNLRAIRTCTDIVFALNGA